MRKYANIDFTLCDSKRYDPDNGMCLAAAACKHKLLEQEEPFEGPLLLSTAMCVGCGDCVSACPCGAISICRGM